MKTPLAHELATHSPPLPPPSRTVPDLSYSAAPPPLKEALPRLPAFVLLLLPLLSLSLCLYLNSAYSLFLLCSVGLAGVTNSVHSYDVLTRKWTRWCSFSIVKSLNFASFLFLLRIEIVSEVMISGALSEQNKTCWRAALPSGCPCCRCCWDYGCFPGIEEINLGFLDSNLGIFVMLGFG